MSNASNEYAREKTARSLDTIAVYNPSTEDVTFWTDKYGPTAAKTLVPNAQKDIGFGNGVAHLPRYKAEMYTEDQIVKVINAISDADWAKKSKQYRTRDEKLQHAEVEAIRTNDRKLWTELFPKYWLGVVEKFGGSALPEPEESRPVDTGSAMGDTLKVSGLADRPYEPQREN